MCEKNTDYDINLNNLSPSLIKYFEPGSDINIDIQSDWKPPKEHGLKNSFIIIPHYYQKCGEKILKVNYYEMIIDDIRNCRKLNEFKLEFIKNLDNNSKQNLFLEFNKLFDIIETLLN